MVRWAYLASQHVQNLSSRSFSMVDVAIGPVVPRATLSAEGVPLAIDT